MEKNAIINNDYLETRRDKCDSIIVSASEKNFNDVFLNEKKWEPIKIATDRVSQIKFIYLYQKKPISAVTYYAKVREIIPHLTEKGKFTVIFEGEPIQLESPIPLGSVQSKAPQNPRYIKSEVAQKAKTTDDLFDY